VPRLRVHNMGRTMFGPVRGPWPDEQWTGWWDDEPAYHHPVFVLTALPRPPLTMAGGTTSSFVSDGIEAALEQAYAAAGGADVRQYLRAGLVDELHVALVPVLLGDGERLFDGEGPAGLECAEFVHSPTVTHVRFTRGAPRG
jgi:dihydrofolate reductase